MRGPCPGAGWTSYARRRVPNVAAATGWTRGGATPSNPVINFTRGSRHTSIQSNRTCGRHNRMLFRCRLLRQWSSLPRWGAARRSGNVPSSWRRRADSCRNGAPRGPRLEPWCTPPLAMARVCGSLALGWRLLRRRNLDCSSNYHVGTVTTRGHRALSQFRRQPYPYEQVGGEDHGGLAVCWPCVRKPGQRVEPIPAWAAS